MVSVDNQNSEVGEMCCDRSATRSEISLSIRRSKNQRLTSPAAFHSSAYLRSISGRTSASTPSSARP
ncbi:hypothetical protein, partial [Roseiconus lacunae]